MNGIVGKRRNGDSPENSYFRIANLPKNETMSFFLERKKKNFIPGLTLKFGIYNISKNYNFNFFIGRKFCERG